MLQRVDVGKRSVEAYDRIAPAGTVEEVRARAEALRGARVLHLSATPYGGGVSELLRSMVPLLNDLGLSADWQVISGNEAFFDVTKTIHNGLQGASRDLDAASRRRYRETSARNAASLEGEYDFVFVHDPQPAGILDARGKRGERWVWRCHIDTSEPDADVWEYVRGFLSSYDAAIFTMREFLPPDLPIADVEIIPPAIDPLSPKNMTLADSTTRGVLDWIGIELNKPLVTQVSRFDPWKDPLGVIAAYRLARQEVPGLQLALVGSMALDDPEAWDVYREITAVSDGDPLIHVFTNLTGVGNIEVNAFQRHSDVVVQKSIREGFGLVVSEAMWKRTPVVAGRAGGIPLQMADDAGGMLVDGVDDCAVAVVRLLQDPETAAFRGRRGRQRVREHFLLPRLLLNELALMESLVAERPLPTRPTPAMTRDPVCGIAVPTRPGLPSVELDGRTYVFCSERCRERFLADSEHFSGGAAVGAVPERLDGSPRSLPHPPARRGAVR